MKLDKPAILAAARTAGALMAGNTFVGYFMLEKRNWLDLVLLLVLGGCVIIASSINKD